MTKQIEKSTPIIITINNVSEQTQTVELFSPLKKYEANEEIIIKVDSFNDEKLNYESLLKYMLCTSISIGELYISCYSGDLRCVTQIIRIHKQNVLGKYYGNTFSPTIDPYQMQSGIVAFKEPFILDNETGVFVKVLPNSKVVYQFYPSEIISLNNLADGKPTDYANTPYTSDDIIRAYKEAKSKGANAVAITPSNTTLSIPDNVQQILGQSKPEKTVHKAGKTIVKKNRTTTKPPKK